MRVLKFSLVIIAFIAFTPNNLKAQTKLTLKECRELAIKNNKDIEMAKKKIEMSKTDRKIALANYFPNISLTGSYTYNQKNISFINDNTSAKLRNMGTLVHGLTKQNMNGLIEAVKKNPAAVKEFLTSPLWQTIVGALSKTDMSALLNQVGTDIDNSMHIDIHNIYIGAVSLEQPIFVGGKIIAANQIAKLAENLSKTQYEKQYTDVLVNVDQIYWQIISISNKLKLATSYSDLLHKMENDVKISIEAGVSTESDLLQIKVKVNEADMLKTKAENGLTLAKMLLCKEIGLELNSNIELADENLSEIPVPQTLDNKSIEQIYEDRPEIKSLNFACKIFQKKVSLARADMLPKVALTANYLVTNPNSFNGFQKKWAGMYNAGIIVRIPLFHGFEALQKTKKAKIEADYYKIELANAKNLINLQVNQLQKQQQEALEKLNMAYNNLKNAEENLRKASIGFKEGVITTNTALAAHTAWLQAQSEYIDAGIELQMNNVNLRRAEGSYNIPKE